MSTSCKKRRPWLATVLLMFVLGLGLLASACEDDVVKQPPAQGSKKVQASEGKASKGSRKSGGGKAAKGADTATQAAVQTGSATWVPRRNWERRVLEESRDPFYGFVDIMVEEQLRQRELAAQAAIEAEEVLLPTQRFDVREFRLVAIVTNTPTPKALLIDPDNSAHIANVGTLIGKRNGVVVDIRRNEIEIFQGDDLVNAPETVVMKLHPEVAAGLLIELK